MDIKEVINSLKKTTTIIVGKVNLVKDGKLLSIDSINDIEITLISTDKTDSYFLSLSYKNAQLVYGRIIKNERQKRTLNEYGNKSIMKLVEYKFGYCLDDNEELLLKAETKVVNNTKTVRKILLDILENGIK